MHCQKFFFLLCLSLCGSSSDCFSEFKDGNRRNGKAAGNCKFGGAEGTRFNSEYRAKTGNVNCRKSKSGCDNKRADKPPVHLLHHIL